jgi:hypothetical protein
MAFSYFLHNLMVCLGNSSPLRDKDIFLQIFLKRDLSQGTQQPMTA